MGGGHAYERNVRVCQIVKTGQSRISKENRQNVTNMTIYQSGNEGYSKENRNNKDSEKVYHELPFHSLLFVMF